VFAIADLSATRVAFYATVATVLPIIMLAFGFQLRARSVLPWSNGWFGTKAAIAVLALALLWVVEMGYAEFSALLSLADGRNESYGGVVLGAGIGVVVLFGGTLDAVVDQLIESFRKDRAEDERAKLEAAAETELEQRPAAQSGGAGAETGNGTEDEGGNEG